MQFEALPQRFEENEESKTERAILKKPIKNSAKESKGTPNLMKSSAMQFVQIDLTDDQSEIN